MEESPSKALRQNKDGLVINDNGTVALKNLDLNRQVPSRTCDRDAKLLFGVKMSWSQAFTFFCLVYGNTPVQKHRETRFRMNIAKSAAPFALSPAQMKLLESAEDAVAHAYLLGMTKNTLQKLRYYFYSLLLFLFFTIISIIYNYFDYFNRYTLWGEVHTFLNSSVFLKKGLRGYPQVQTHLGLTGPNENKSIMDMYVSTIF